jgi:4-alpha-glucanotransferase
LPGPFGIGDFGAEAYRFVDFLHGAAQKLWQVLPLNPTGYGDSPYQAFSAFAGNPLLISLEKLVEQGVLGPDDLKSAPLFPDHEVDYGAIMAFKFPLLRKAACNFHRTASGTERSQFGSFCCENAAWLDDYALFMACKDHYGSVIWTQWPAEIASRRPIALQEWKGKLAGEIAALKYWQFEFYRQWDALKTSCRRRGIRIMGDIPIYVAHDSADVWAHRDLFCLDEQGQPTKVAGVPPDYFSATGQLWGNPIYRWDALKNSGYRWWIDRFRAALRLYDVVRLDHFRGFEAYWEVPAGESTAVNGRWVKGPGAELFSMLQQALGELPIVAENLGVITAEVEAIRRQFGFPGMSLLQFAFGKDPQGPSFRPHNYPRELMAYTGGHDNDTTIGWWTSPGGGDSTRTREDVCKEHEFARAYLGFENGEINWIFIRAVLSSIADTAIIPLQDVLGVGSEARMNLPGKPSGNWKWRFLPGALTPQLQDRLRQMTLLYDR